MRKLEVIASSLESLIESVAGGADRIELCVNLFCGGTTPSGALTLASVKAAGVPVNILIRPRAGDFCYDRAEVELICKEIDFAKKSGAAGVVCGFLLPDGSIDVELTKLMVQLAKPMSFTFHRAFDICNDPEKGLEGIIQAGCDRLLTSGQKNTAIEGKELISRLVTQSAGRIIVMPGSGVNADNIGQLIEIGATEFHTSASINKKSKSEFNNPMVLMSDNAVRDSVIQTTSQEKVVAIKNILKKYQ